MPAVKAAGVSRHWAQIDEISFVAGMRVLFWLGRALGRWPFRVVLYPVLLWYAIAKPWARAASQDYLRRIAELDGTSGSHTGVMGMLRHFAVLRRMHSRQIAPMVRFVRHRRGWDSRRRADRRASAPVNGAD